jgi:hypothetical protein
MREMTDEGIPTVEMRVLKDGRDVVELKVALQGTGIGHQGDGHQQQERRKWTNREPAHARGYTALRPDGIGGTMTVSKLMACSLLAVIAPFWIPADSRAQGSAQAPCGCTQQDKIDMESRTKQVDAAIRELDRMIKDWEGRERGAGEKLFLNEELRTVLMRDLGFSMIKDPKAVSYGAETDPTCAVTIDPKATRCLRIALEDHESVHKKVCDEKKSLNPFVDFRSSQRVVDYLKEEKAGYQKERSRLTSDLDLQKKNCTTVTQLDKSTQQQLQQLLAQRERLRGAKNRLEMYGTRLN